MSDVITVPSSDSNGRSRVDHRSIDRQGSTRMNAETTIHNKPTFNAPRRLRVVTNATSFSSCFFAWPALAALRKDLRRVVGAFISPRFASSQLQQSGHRQINLEIDLTLFNAGGSLTRKH